MNSICEDIKDMLEANESLGLIFASNLFIRQSPAEPLNIVTIFDTSAGNPTMMLDGNACICNDSFQIIIQNQEYDEAYTLAHMIIDYLQTISNQVWNDTRYLIISLISGPSQLAGGGVSILQTGRKRGQVEVSINFQIKRTKS